MLKRLTTSFSNLFGLNKFEKGPVDPDLPVEYWLLIIENIDLGITKKIEHSWIGRTLITRSVARNLDGLRPPKGCDRDNPWVIVLVGFSQKKILQMSKRDFLEEFVDVPLLPEELFYKSYEKYLNEAEGHLQSTLELLRGL